MNSHDVAVAADPAQIVAIAKEVFSALVDDGEVLVRERAEVLFPDEPVYAWVDMTREGEAAVVRTSVRMDASGTNALARALLRMDADEVVSPEDLVDAFGEVANVVGGNVKSLLPEQAMLSLPTVRTAATEADIGVVLSDVTLEWRGYALVISLSVVAAT